GSDAATALTGSERVYGFAIVAPAVSRRRESVDRDSAVDTVVCCRLAPARVERSPSMLTPDQIIPFVTREDPLVREHVVQYFDKPSAYGPLTAEHYWQAIDRFGMEESRGFLTHLEDVPQTDASVARLLAMLRDKPSERARYDLQQTAGNIVFHRLRDHREELLDCE